MVLLRVFQGQLNKVAIDLSFCSLSQIDILQGYNNLAAPQDGIIDPLLLVYAWLVNLFDVTIPVNN